MPPSKASDLVQKYPNIGENASAFVIGESVMAVHFESFYSKQDTQWELPLDFAVKKAIGTDRNQKSIGLFGQEKVVQFRREVSCSSSPNFLKASDDQRSLEYPELSSRLFIGKQSLSRKEKWKKLSLEYQLSKGV